MAVAPGLFYKGRSPVEGPSPLRSDVAGFVGKTRRGPLLESASGKPEMVRVVGLRRFELMFGGAQKNCFLSYCAKGYFENGGRIAHVIRLGGGDARQSERTWQVGTSEDGLDQLLIDPVWEKENEKNKEANPKEKPELKIGIGTGSLFLASSYKIVALNPGKWGDDISIQIQFVRTNAKGEPSLSFSIRAPGESSEYIDDVIPNRTEELERSGKGPTLVNRINAESSLIRISPVAQAYPSAQKSPERKFIHAPPSFRWPEIKLAGGANPAPTIETYRDAILRLFDQPEVAIIALPDLFLDLNAEESVTILKETASLCAKSQDRMILIDLPPDKTASSCLVKFAESKLRHDIPLTQDQRAAAIYHPWLCVRDPVGVTDLSYLAVPPSGHIAGVLSRIDRESGAHHTPANVPLLDAVDVVSTYLNDDAGLLNDNGINLIRPRQSIGLQVWGGRTLDLNREGRYIAHRRLIHRLVRSIRRVAEPIVFNNNGPRLWLMLARAVTTILLEAFEAGALKGDRDEEAFAVRCDEMTNSESGVETGTVLCEIDLAPAVPMEFITLRVAISETGKLEVFDL